MAITNLGFRIFFFLAALSAVILIGLWSGFYLGAIEFPSSQISSISWHAHEMIYGYCLAVIAGFLLTAVKNWTGVPTITGLPLLLLALLWLAARLLLLNNQILLAAIFDIGFLLFLNVAVAIPIIKVKQWRQIAVLSKLVLFLILNLWFYLGALGHFDSGIRISIYGGLYLVIGLILMMGKRLIPFFVKAATSKELPNTNIYDKASLGLFLIFFLAELIPLNSQVASYSAAGIFLVNAIRLLKWNRKEAWQSPLLWVLYLSLWFITFGFLLFAASAFLPVSKFIAIHAMAYGGIGLITIGMMARVSLGHTGRNVYQPPKLIGLIFSLLALGAIARVFAPLFVPSHYLTWMGISQLLWIVAFIIFLFIYGPMLCKARIDGKSG